MLIPESCHEFSAPWLSWELGKGSVSLVALKHSVGGAVLSSEHQGDVSVTITREDGSKVNLGPLKARSSPAGGLEYRFELMARPGEHLTLEPRAEKLLFSPPSVTITTGSDCQPEAAMFRGEKGHFVEGIVTPPLDGVEITVSQNGEVISVINTDKQGKHSILH